MTDLLNDTYMRLVSDFIVDPVVALKESRGFGSGGLTVHGKLFAVQRGDALLLKLPARRVAELISSEVGMPFDANKGRAMREWILIKGTEAATWPALAREALTFVGG